MPTKELLKANNMLSVHQLGFLSIATTIRKILSTKKPDELFVQVEQCNNKRGTEWKVRRPTQRLNVTMEGIIERRVKVINMLPEELKIEKSEKRFKKNARNGHF